MKKDLVFIFHTISTAVMVYGCLLLPSIIVSLLSREYSVVLTLSFIFIACGLFGWVGHTFFDNEIKKVSIRDCFMITILTWLVIIFLTTLPFYLCGNGYRYLDCLYDATAAWTTTGTAAIDVPTLPNGLQLFRSSCNWAGGMGIILLTLTFLPMRQFVGRNLAYAESPGPGFLKSNTTFRHTYRNLFMLYVSITAVQFILLLFSSALTPFEALLTALSNSSTSGLEHLNNGDIRYLPTYPKVIITFFACFVSLNVGSILYTVKGSFKTLFKNGENRFAFIRILILTLIITGTLAIEHKIDGGILRSFGSTLMQVISFVSTAGYRISDESSWPFYSKILILVFMLIGACSLSTGGGIKIARTIIAGKTIHHNLSHVIHPRNVRLITYDSTVLRITTIQRANLYICVYFLTFSIGALLLTWELDIDEAFFMAATMLSNIGVSIDGPTDPSYITNLSGFSRLVLSFLMLAGKLEIYPVILLGFRSFWREEENA